MRNIKLILEYEGTNYRGWQRQRNTPLTIQEIVENALKKILQEDIKVVGAGRTDRGVHAYNQVANFKTYAHLGLRNIRNALNSLLSADIRIKSCQEVSLDFHARFRARSRRYRYVIDNGSVPSVFTRRFSWYIPYPLDMEIMRRQLGFLIGTNDFSSFTSSGSSCRNRIKTVYHAAIKKCRGFIHIDIEADGFLYNMVRNIVGTLIDFSLGKNKLSSLQDVLGKRSRPSAGRCAPAKGLILWRVKY